METCVNEDIQPKPTALLALHISSFHNISKLVIFNLMFPNNLSWLADQSRNHSYSQSHNLLSPRTMPATRRFPHSATCSDLCMPGSCTQSRMERRSWCWSLASIPGWVSRWTVRVRAATLAVVVVDVVRVLRVTAMVPLLTLLIVLTETPTYCSTAKPQKTNTNLWLTLNFADDWLLNAAC